jgi:hypothetical protein
MMPKNAKFVNARTGRQEDTMIYSPTGTYKHKIDNSGIYVNPNFDPSRGMSEVPNKFYYDTSDRMRYIKQQGLQDLYDAIVDTMEKSHSKYDSTGRPYNYHLPKIDSDTAALISRIFKNGFSATRKAIWDNMTKI